MFRLFLACALLILAACAPSPQTTSAPAPVPPTTDIQAAVNATLTAVRADAPTPTIPPTARPSSTPLPTRAATPTPGLCKFREICTSGLVSLAVVGKENMTVINQVFRSQQGKFLVLDVALENDGQPVPYNMLYFRLRDRGGREYNPTIAPEPSFKSGSLGKGELVRGLVAFDVPASASGFILTYAPLTFPTPAPIRVDLGE